MNIFMYNPQLLREKIKTAITMIWCLLMIITIMMNMIMMIYMMTATLSILKCRVKMLLEMPIQSHSYVLTKIVIPNYTVEHLYWRLLNFGNIGG